jgi:predicted ribosomally synthesized peptide with SipW-like signal peptide
MNKILAVALAVTMLALIGVSATLAYLYDKDDAITNTFAVGKVYLELTEDVVDLEIVPADTDDKKPVVTVLAGSESAYVFVKVDETLGSLQTKATELGKNFSDYVTYSVDAAIWAPMVDENSDGKSDNGVYYKTVTESATATVLDVLTDDEVSYPAAITNEMLLAAQTGDVALGNTVEAGAAGAKPTLTFTAYAIQELGFADVNAAYAQLKTVYTELP